MMRRDILAFVPRHGDLSTMTKVIGPQTYDSTPDKVRRRLIGLTLLIFALFLSSACGSDRPGPTVLKPNEPAIGAIVFVSERDDNAEIYSMKVDGSGLKRLTRNPARDYFPVWSPDGTRIAFLSDRNGVAEVHVMNADGSEVTGLTETGGAVAFDWSPDGTKLAYYDGFILGVTGADGTGFRQIILGADGPPSWSPDGERIAFSVKNARLGTRSDVHLTDLEASDIRILTDDGQGNADPPGLLTGSESRSLPTEAGAMRYM